MAEEEAKEGAENAAAGGEKKSSKKLFIIIGAVVLLLLAGGVPALYFLVLKKPPPAVEELEVEVPEGDVGSIEGSGDELEIGEGEESLGAIVPFDTFVVNLPEGKYIRVQLQVEFETLDVPSRFYSRMVPLRDGVISLLTQQVPEDLMTQKGKENLRTQIRGLMNDTLRKEEVRRVYFTQFVIQ
jgi:flagellar FliL protein